MNQGMERNQDGILNPVRREMIVEVIDEMAEKVEERMEGKKGVEVNHRNVVKGF